MKHPILYRVGIYSCIGVLCLGILAMMHVMNEAPFKSLDMRDAYLAGCNFGSRPVTEESFQECVKTADMFKETLDDLDKQMEKINERNGSQ